MDPLELAYAAGVIDSDGCIGIKKSDYAMRVRGDSTQHIYSERVTVKQVEVAAIDLLHRLFGGHRGITDPSAVRGRPLHTWHIHSKSAGAAIVALLPYLRIKKAQAENAIRMRSVLNTPRRWPVPRVIDGEGLATTHEFAAAVGTTASTVMQAARLGSVPSVKVGRRWMVPASYADTYRLRLVNKGKMRRPQEVTDQLEACYVEAKHLNRVGAR